MSTSSEIKKTCAEIMEGKEQRTALNATINAGRKKLRALGMTTANINEALRILDADGTQRGAEDYGRNLFRTAYGFPAEFDRVTTNIQDAEAALKDKPATKPAAGGAPVH